MTTRSYTHSTTGSIEDIRCFLSIRFDTCIVIEKKSDELYEWAAKRGSHWGKIVPDEPHQFTKGSPNVVGFELKTEKAFLVEVTSAEED